MRPPPAKEKLLMPQATSRETENITYLLSPRDLFNYFPSPITNFPSFHTSCTLFPPITIKL